MSLFNDRIKNRNRPDPPAPPPIDLADFMFRTNNPAVPAATKDGHAFTVGVFDSVVGDQLVRVTYEPQFAILEVLKAVDSLLGTDYAERYPKGAFVNELVPPVEHTVMEAATAYVRQFRVVDEAEETHSVFMVRPTSIDVWSEQTVKNGLVIAEQRYYADGKQGVRYFPRFIHPGETAIIISQGTWVWADDRADTPDGQGDWTAATNLSVDNGVVTLRERWRQPGTEPFHRAYTFTRTGMTNLEDKA